MEMTKIDKQDILRLCRDDKTNEEIKDELRCSAEYIRQQRIKLVEKGELEERFKFSHGQKGRRSGKLYKPATVVIKPDGNGTSLLKRIIDAVELATSHKDMFDFLMMSDELRKELTWRVEFSEKYPEILESNTRLKRENTRLEKDYQLAVTQIAVERLARQQGELNEPLKGRQYYCDPTDDGLVLHNHLSQSHGFIRENGLDFTYHIPLYDPEFTREYEPSDNITSEVFLFCN